MANLLLCLVQLGSINRNWRISDLTANAGGGVDYNWTIDIVPVYREGGREGKRQAGSTGPLIKVTDVSGSPEEKLKNRILVKKFSLLLYFIGSSLYIIILLASRIKLLPVIVQE